MRSVIDRLKTYVEKNAKRGEKIFVTITLTNGHKFEGYINPDYDELSVELITSPGGGLRHPLICVLSKKINGLEKSLSY